MLIKTIFAGTTMLATAGIASAQTMPKDKPVAFRGVELGISLVEFKAFPPVNDQQQGSPATRCANDQTPNNESDETQGVGTVVTCQWFGKMMSYSTRLSSMFVELGAGQTLPEFDFIDVGGTKRLFRITSFANSEYVPAILDALTRGYGAPKVTTAPFKTVGGGDFTATTSRWANAFSEIVITEPCRQLQRYCLTYRHLAYGKLYDAIVEKRAAAAATKL